MVKLYYWKNVKNAGDYYGYWLAKKLYKSVGYSETPRLITVGSILGHKCVSNNTICWGAGWANSKYSTKCKITNKANFKAVRGKLTAEFLHLPDTVALGDPGLLASKFYTPKQNIKTDKIIIISHWQDYKALYAKFSDRYKVINMATNNIEDIFETISHAELVLSSSLHGIIFAHSFGVPAIHIEEGDIGSKNNFKFKDYYSVLDIPYTKYFANDILNFGTVNTIWQNRQQYKPSKACIIDIQNKLLAALPSESELTDEKIALCAIAKEENNYLREWVEHYRNLGFDKIFLFDNNDEYGEHFTDVIWDYIESGFVKVLNVRGLSNQQIKCYDELYHSQELSGYSWVAFFDIDEFLHINKEDIHEYVNDERFNNFDGIAVNWKYFDDNNLVCVDDNNYSITRFTHEYVEKDWQYAQHRFTKRIMRTNCDLTVNSSHGPIRAAKMSEYKAEAPNTIAVCNTDGQKIINDIVIKNWTHRTAYLAHYRYKTISEYINLKLKRGYPTLYKNSGKDLSIGDFFCLNKPTPEKIEYAAKFYNTSESNLQPEIEAIIAKQQKTISSSILKEKLRENKKDTSNYYLYF